MTKHNDLWACGDKKKSGLDPLFNYIVLNACKSKNSGGGLACARTYVHTCTHVRAHKRCVFSIRSGLSSQLSHHDHNSLVIDRSSLTH